MQQSWGEKLALRFPTYGQGQSSYVLPDSKEAYLQMLRVIAMAVKDKGFHMSEVSGDAQLALSVQGDLTPAAPFDARFSLHIDGLCVLDGITTTVSYNKPFQKHVVGVNMPTIPVSGDQDERQEYLAVFQGLRKACYDRFNHARTLDHAFLIEKLVLEKRYELLHSDHTALADGSCFQTGT